MNVITDNMHGALLISIVDFVLSFVIISGIGVILWLLPFINHLWEINEEKLRKGHEK